MKAKMKRFLSIVLSLAMVLGMMPGMSLTAYANTEHTGMVTFTEGETAPVQAGDILKKGVTLNTTADRLFVYDENNKYVETIEKVESRILTKDYTVTKVASQDNGKEWFIYLEGYVQDYVWVGGIQVTEDNAGNITGEETPTASYNMDTRTLTLNNYNYSGHGIAYGNVEAGIMFATQKAVTIELIGENSITMAETNQDNSYGIYGWMTGVEESNLTIIGNGKLVTKGGNAKSNSCGIYTTKNITFAGGIVQAEGGNVDQYGSNGVANQNGGINIDGGNLIAIGGVNGQYGSSYGTNAGIGNDTTCKTVFESGSLKAFGNTQAVYHQFLTYGGEEHEWGGFSVADNPTSFKAGDNEENATDVTSYSNEKYVYVTAPKTVKQTVTFKVQNGAWNEGEGDAATADRTVTLTGYEGDTLKLTADQIPTVGNKPNDTYKAGSWDVTPSVDTAITAATTYTYTYAQKDAATVTKDPTAKSLTYNGQPQELVIAGEATGGTMQYALGTATEATEQYTTSIPAKTDAGTYYVWYMAKGDENHNDSEPKCVTATISAAKATAATVTANNRTYDGTQKPLVTVDDSTLVGGEMQYALGTETEATEQYTTSIPTATNAGTYYVWYKVVGDENYNDSKADCVVAKIGAVISKTVTFKVVNGAWNDETTEEKTVTLIGYEGDTLKLAANQIPAVGNKPGDIYKAGSWDVTPDTETAITADITYTYTYVEKNPISVNVTFKVVNGSWNEGEGDEATKDKTVTLTGYEGDTLKLAANQIPAVGNKPNDTYKAGSWDVAPSTDAGITKAMTYTYIYVAKEAAVVTKAPEAKILTYNGQSQELVNAGEVTGGTMLYAFGTDATTEPAAELYKTSIPAGTDAGTYCVWYKVVGDENHTDVATDKVNVTIAKKNLIVTADAKTIIYGDDDAELTYKVTGLVEGDAQDKVVTGTITREAGTEAGTYRITQGTLASENYDITFTEADYTIKKAVQAAPEEQFTSTKSTNAENEDGKISGFDKEKAYQYSSDDGKTWTDVTGKTDVDVKAGTYLIRYAEDKNHESGQTVTITVEAEQQVVPEPEEQAVIINLKSVTQKKNKIQISWTKVKEADGYDVYVDYCGTKSKKAVKTIKKNSITKTSINKINGKKINQKKCFHAYVVAYKMVDGKKVKLAKTVAAHVAGAKRKGYTNPKTLKLTKSSFSIKVGKTAKIKAKVTLADSKKKHISKGHGAKLRYKSSDKKIASIDKNGKIKGIKKGTCTIYVYTINGIMKKTKVTVK